MTWKDKLEIGLKEDAPFRRDNLPDDQTQGRKERKDDRSPVVSETRRDENDPPVQPRARPPAPTKRKTRSTKE